MGKIVKAVTKASHLPRIQGYLMVPKMPEQWMQIARDYQNWGNYPMCLGSLDGKHLRISKPKNSGSTYWNYKSYNSIVLFALTSATYDILYIDIGTEGWISDSGIWAAFSLCSHLEKGSLHIPEAGKLPNTDTTVNYHFIGDDAFPLEINMMVHIQLQVHTEISVTPKYIRRVVSAITIRHNILNP